MRRPTLILVGAVVVSAVAALLLLRRESGATTRPDLTSEQPALDQPPSPRGPMTGDLESIRPRPFDLSTEAASDPKVVKTRRSQAEAIEAASRLLGDKLPSDYDQKQLGEDDLKAFRAEMEKFDRRERQITDAWMQAGVKRAQEVYDAGGWQVWPERKITVPYPGKPGQMITRRAVPEDDKGEDDFISETGAEGPNGLPESHVVRLRPESDAKWATVVAERRTQMADLRLHVRATLDTYFRR